MNLSNDKQTHHKITYALYVPYYKFCDCLAIVTSIFQGTCKLPMWEWHDRDVGSS